MLYTTPLPPPPSPANDCVADGAPDARSEDNLAELEGRHAARWNEQPETLPELGTPFRRRDQRQAERAADRLLDDIEPDLLRLTAEPSARETASARLQEKLRRFGADALAMPTRELDIVASDDFFTCTHEFAREARAFDPELGAPDLFQALRNVWIVNVLQRHFAQPVALSPAITGYSLLYPVTDNWLDDPTVSTSDKTHFGERLGARLAGADLAPRSAHELQTYRLVAMIEQVFPRRAYPEVYRCLLAIHGGQMRSLAMQSASDPEERSARGGAALAPPSVAAASVVAGSIAKGGASVLTDGYLITGRVAPVDADFCFGYGAVLQLIDDLQDVAEDRATGHATLFSRQVGHAPLDGLVCKLLHFLDASLAGTASNPADPPPLLSLMRSQCRRMIIYAAAQHREHFGLGFLHRLESFVPLRFAYGRKNRKRFLRRALRIHRTLSRNRTRGRAGILETLLETALPRVAS